MDPAFLALSRLRRRRFDEALQISSELLDAQPLDQAAWLIKTRALIAKDFVDDVELEDEGIAEVLLDDNAMAKAPRPGTSLRNPSGTAASDGGAGAQLGGGLSGALNAAIRPVTASGRPLTGFARPGTQSRGSASLQGAFAGDRPGTSRPLTTAGRVLRLGTQSMLSGSAQFIDPDRIDMKRYARRPALAKALCDYLLYSVHNPKKALELAAEATRVAEFRDPWWKARLGKCYYQLGLFREAEAQFKSALRHQDNITFTLELAKVALRLDQPNSAIDLYLRALDRFPGDSTLLIAIARVYEGLHNLDSSVDFYRRALQQEGANVEAIASLASHHFYTDQPEVALRYYRRLLQMGVSNVEIWNNVALCCFFSGHYDLALGCFERALAMASDDNMADVWYNIGHVAIRLGDMSLAAQAFKLAVSVDPQHAEALNNLGVLELRKGNVEAARASFASSSKVGAFLYEPNFNAGLLAFKLGDCQAAFEHTRRSLALYPRHAESLDLLAQLKRHFSVS